MIDFWKNKRQRKSKTILKELLFNALPLFLIFYGLKCVITLHGQQVEHIKTPGPFTVPVSGTAAIMVGLSYIGFGLFLGLSFSDPLDEKCSKLWRIVRGMLRWGGLVAWIGCALKARRLAGIDIYSPTPNISLWTELKADFGMALIFVAFLIFFAAIFCLMMIDDRNIIKQDLSGKGLERVSIRARPLSYWGRAQGFAYRVIYLDKDGFTHRAYCCVSGRKVRSVIWFKDELEVIDV